MNTSPTPRPLSRAAFLRAAALAAPLMPLALTAQTPPPPPMGDTGPDLGNLRTFVELARSDIRTQKSLIIAENIDFTADEAVDFWPLQREYELELNKLQDQRNRLILRFATQYGTMTDPEARDLARGVFDLEARRTGLKKKYFKKFARVVTALKAARFFQIENQINMAIELQIAASLPLIK